MFTVKCFLHFCFLLKFSMKLLRLMACSFFLTLSCNNAQKNNMDARIFRNDTIAGSNLSGFGYDILINGKLYIHQPYIPAINGAAGFLFDAAARKNCEYIAK